MTSIAWRLSSRVDAWGARAPRQLLALIAAVLILFLVCMGIALKAAFDGPIGVELLEPFGWGDVSRLTVLQFSTFFAGISVFLAAVLVAAWDNAPAPLRLMLGAPMMKRVARKIEKGFSPGSAKMYWAVVGVCAAWVNFEMLWRLPVLACLEPDTVGYLTPSPMRSAGYMVFINAVVGLTGDLKWMLPVQLNLMLASFAVLGWSVRHTLQSLGAGLIVAVVPMLSAGILLLAPAIMTEALFAALICLHMAGVVWALRNPSWWVLVLSGVALAFMIVLRPNGISFLVGVGALAYLMRPYWQRVLIAMVIPVVVVVGLQGAYNKSTFGFFGLHKFGELSLIGNFAPLIRGDMQTEHPDLAKELETKLRHYSRDFSPFEERSFPYEMAHVAELTSAGAIYKIVVPTLRDRLGLPEPKAFALQYDPRMNALAGEMTTSAMKHDPIGALKIVMSNFIVNWDKTLPIRVPMNIYYPRCLDMSRTFHQTHGDFLHGITDDGSYADKNLEQDVAQIGSSGIRTIEYPRLLISVLQKPLAYLALVLALTGSLWLVLKGANINTGQKLWSLTALIMCSGYGVISIGNTAFTRYTVVFDPVVVVMLVGGVLICFETVFSKRSL